MTTNNHTANGNGFVSPWTRFAGALRNFTTSEVRWRARFLFSLLVGFLFVINGLNVLNSFVARDFMTAIEHRDLPGFQWLALAWIGVFGASTLVATIHRFTEERLAILWREWLTARLIDRYLEHRAYWSLGSDTSLANPDQRIAEDTRAFTTTTLSFVLMLLNATFTVLAFAGVLWSISRALFLVSVAYAALGSLFTILLGRPLVGLNYDQLDHEADFRSELIHIRQNAEALALLHREPRVGHRLRERLHALSSNWRRIVGVNRRLNFFTTGYNYLIQIIPALVIAPFFIRGEVEFGVITQSAMAFSQLLGAFSLIVTQFQSISSFAAVVTRLSSLADALENVPTKGGGIEVRETIDTVEWEDLTLFATSDSRTLVRALRATVHRGSALGIEAQDEEAGVALFRASAGLWKEGEGIIARPGLGDIAFLAERPYLPPGTLRLALVGIGREEETGDRRVLEVLGELGLGGLVERLSGLDVEKAWSDVLSLAEQQLLAIARLLLAEPSFAFLDRPGTALDDQQVALVLDVLSRGPMGIVVFQPSSTSRRHFDALLEIAADGTWEWKPLSPPMAPTAFPPGQSGE